MFQVYYHLYLGPSWQTVWALHRPFLEQFAASGLMSRLVVCVGGSSEVDLGLASIRNAEIRQLSGPSRQINEFHTIAQMRSDANDATQRFEHCVYLHSKGAASGSLDRRGSEWSSFLSIALFRALPSFGRLVAAGFTSTGSNLALGIFEDFGPPRLHYSGNFWCATRSVVASAPEIMLGQRHASVRHNAEWWIGQSAFFIPFNAFSTGIDHYTAAVPAVDWPRLERRLDELGSGSESPEHSMQSIAFLGEMLHRAVGSSPARHAFSDALLGVLPHHRWPRLLNVHNLAMGLLGSRKSVYVYCPETR